MVVTTGNIIYKVVSREIEKERFVRDFRGGIFGEEKVVEFVLEFSQFVMDTIRKRPYSGGFCRFLYKNIAKIHL
jgi:hypothetical protein